MQLSTIASTVDTQTPWMGGAVSTSGVRLLGAYDALFREGDETTGFYEILSGAVRAYKIFPDGRRQIVAFGFAGDIVGFGHGETYRFDCDALTMTRVRAIHKSSLLRAMRERPELAEKLLKVAGDEVASMQDLSILLCRKTAIERMASFLLSMAGRTTSDMVPLPMCRADIADYLGLTIETVSRNMTRLRAMRVIDLPNRGNFVVRDMDRLRLLAQCDGNMH
ncbi:MAG: helix-turn-helix domain-containing protein [Devosia sp.]|jgi:CRP-like cAMP-binding protein|nr:helix-turn-helix domain-containing protein [Alphaproteobacteria bacterium]MBU1561482.1 helix-turn-helix domain-containing protein [Alphaproteobacteria bacterium]MBU2301194.1 helix-turn-helix domain-containing protein [Alphaproteobacteria bacterium]MBU2369002.1 helix-turn-helix domain-containing protein [Alphaproteobacteria bacterium]